jgi:hypothetical protein
MVNKHCFFQDLSRFFHIKIRNIAEFSTYVSPLKKSIVSSSLPKLFIKRTAFRPETLTARDIKIVSGVIDSFKHFARNLGLQFQINQEDFSSHTERDTTLQ